MIRLTRHVFADLAIWMGAFGAATGVLFPFFAWAMGLPHHDVLSPSFFAACIFAGVAVGAANIGLARSVVGQRLRVLASRMEQVEHNLQHMIRDGADSACKAEDCLVAIDSDDDFGTSARSFNNLVQTLDSSFRSERAVRDFSELLTGELGLEPLANKALQQLTKHTSCNAGAVFINDDGETKVCAALGIDRAARILRSGLLQRAVNNGEAHSLELPEDVVMDGVLTAFRPREVLIEPIVFNSMPLGAVLLASATGFSSDDRTNLQLLRRGLALSFHNAILYERSERLAAVDALTGLYNRRFGMSRLQEEFSRAMRGRSPVGLLMFDIDHFKRVNDTYGHLVGDRVLKQIAQITRTVARQDDLVMRYGGEEFLMVLPGASTDDAANVAERLRQLVEDTPFAAAGHKVRVTLSVGAASYPSCNAKDAIDSVRLADEALYAAKKSGRNRVVVHGRAEVAIA